MCGRSDWFWFIGSTFLTIHGELNHIIVSSCRMFTLADWLTWVNVRGGCYKCHKLSFHAFEKVLLFPHTKVSIGLIYPLFISSKDLVSPPEETFPLSSFVFVPNPQFSHQCLWSVSFLFPHMRLSARPIYPLIPLSKDLVCPNE